MAKKILSLALVVVMLMSMFAFSTSAADLTSGQIGFRVETEGLVEGAPAGTIVTFKVYYVIPEGADLTNALGNTAVAYDNTKFAYVADSCQWGDHYAEGFNAPGATSVSTTTAISNNIAKAFNANDKAKGWNAGLQVKQTYISLDDGGIWSATTGYPVTDEDYFFSIQFEALEPITADSVIGLPEGTYSKSFFKVNDFTNGMYAVGSVVLTDATATPEAAVAANKVYAVKDDNGIVKQVRKNGDNIDMSIKAGFKASDINIDFYKEGDEGEDVVIGKSKNVDVVGAYVTKNDGTPATGTSRFVYDVNGDGSEYQYRVIISDVEKTSTDVYTIQLFVKMTDGTEILGDTVTITAADVVGKLPA